MTTRGFTLIELLVVIAIIALLTSTVLASLSYISAGARDARRHGDMQSFMTANELMHTVEGHYLCASNKPHLIASDQWDGWGDHVLSKYLLEHKYLSEPLVDPINLIDDNTFLIYQYRSYHNPGESGESGQCGRYYEVHFIEENGWHERNSPCGFGIGKGEWIYEQWCQMFVPSPPPCANPYAQPVSDECLALVDEVMY